MRDRICACGDDACADKVTDEHKRWARANALLLSDEGELASDAQLGRMYRIERAFQTCSHRFRSSSDAQKAMAKMIEFKDAMCRCTNKPCAVRVTDEMTRWSQEMAKNVDKTTRVSDDDVKKMEVVTEQFTQCATRAMMRH